MTFRLERSERHIVIICAVNTDDKAVYRLNTGEKIFRLSASNYRPASAGKVHSITLLQDKLEDMQNDAIVQNQELMALTKTLRQAEQENNALASKLKGSAIQFANAISKTKRMSVYMETISSDLKETIASLHARILAEKKAVDKVQARSKSMCNRIMSALLCLRY